MTHAPELTAGMPPEDLLVGAPIYGGAFSTSFSAATLSRASPDLPVPPALRFVLPGEHVLAASPEEIFPTIVAPSPDRVSPRCPYFGPCGGCHYQHASYPAQLALKREILHELLAPLAPLPAMETHAADPWQYRNRIRLRVEAATNPGAFQVGYNRRASNDLLPIDTCPIAAPILLRTALALTDLAGDDPHAARWLAATAELELFALPDESAVQLQLFLRDAPATATRAGRFQPLPASKLPAAFAALCDTLKARVPELHGATAEPFRSAHANASIRPTQAVQRLAPVSWGKPGLLYPVPPPASASLWVSRGSFFQVNRKLLPELVAIAIKAVRTPVALAWDLFAGAGLFARALAPFTDRITAVESAPGAIADLRAARLPNVDVVASTVLDFLRTAVISRDRPDLVLLDPPRAGLGLEAAALLTRVGPSRIVYISCDPVTLARDLGAMLSSGYRLAELHLVDMFPQTFHIETVAVLFRADLAVR